MSPDAAADSAVAPRSPVQVELDVLARAIGGAMLFGVPLLFTMEMWWIGEYAARSSLLAFLGVAFAINVALANLSGFRHVHATLAHDVAQAIEAMAVAALLSVAVLAVLGRLDTGASLQSTLGMVGVQVIPLSLGAMVANIVFAPGSDRVHGDQEGEGDDDDDGGYQHGSPLRELVSDVAATFAGAIFIGFAIAPTEEVPMLAAGLNLWNTLAIIALSLAASYLIVFASGFDPSHRTEHPGGVFQRPVTETFLAYGVSLVASLVMLMGFGQVEPGDPVLATAASVLVLAVPASIGGAAGRVVV